VLTAMTRKGTKKISPSRRKKRPRQPHQVTTALYVAHSSPAEVARLEGVSKALVSRVIRGRGTSDRIRRRIEQITGKPWRELVAEQS